MTKAAVIARDLLDGPSLARQASDPTTPEVFPAPAILLVYRLASDWGVVARGVTYIDSSILIRREAPLERSSRAVELPAALLRRVTRRRISARSRDIA